MTQPEARDTESVAVPRGLSPLPWSYHRKPTNTILGSRDWIEDANGSVVFENIGHIDGPFIVARANASPDQSAEIERLRAGKHKLTGISLEVAKNLVEHFGGEETDMTVQFIENGHSGPGFYSWCTEYPEDGSDFLGAASEYSYLPTALKSGGA